MKNGRDPFNVPWITLQWFLAKITVILPNHRLSHVQLSPQVAEIRRAPSLAHVQVIDQKKAKAELLRREVELKNLLKCQEMERQMERQIAEMKIQEDELKRRIALLTVEGEIEKAKAMSFMKLRNIQNVISRQS